MPVTQDPLRRRWWPSDPSLFTDTRVCPACFTPLGTTLCRACGLDLAVPSSGNLLEAGAAVAAAEAKRQGLLDRMRAEQDARERIVEVNQVRQAYADDRQYAPYPVVPAPSSGRNASPQAGSPPAPSEAPEAPALGAPPAGPQWTPPGRPPRRSGIQILMLTVGVILVSIMALFFVLLAYLVASLEVRSILTAIASVAVFGVAVFLVRRRLQGTAEGVTALAVVLFLLDLWIIRANGLFGTDGIDGWLYGGTGMGVLAGLLAWAARALPLRTLSLAAALLAPLAGFSFVHGVLAAVDPATRAWAALAAVGVASLAWTRVSRTAERGIVRVSGMLAAAVAALPAFAAFPDTAVGASIAFIVLAGVWFSILFASHGRTWVETTDAAAPRRMDGWTTVSAIGLGIVASGAGLSLATRSELADTAIWLPAAATTLAAVIVASLARPRRRVASALRLAATIPLGLAALASLPAVAYSLAVSGWGAATQPFSLSAFGSPRSPLIPLDGDAALGLVLIGALALAAITALGRRGAAWAPVFVGGLGLVAAGASIGQPVGSAICLGAVSAALIAAGALAKSVPLRMVFAVLFALGVTALGTIGLTSAVTFPVTAIVTPALLVSARAVIVRTTWDRGTAVLAPVATGAAAVAVLAGVRMVPTWFTTVTDATPVSSAPALWMTIAAVLCSVGILLVGQVARAEAAVLAAVSALAVGAGLVELTAAGHAIPLGTALAVTAIAAVLWQLRRTVADWPERRVAAAVAPVATLSALGIGWTEFAPSLSGLEPVATVGAVLAAATVLLAAAALLLFRRNHNRTATHPARIAWDGALALSAVLLIAWEVARPALGWLTLILLAVAAVLVAFGDGGLFAGTSPRRHVAWLGLPLAVAGLWLGLVRADATVVEYYTLPVAGLLLGVLWLALSRRPVTGDAPESGRTVLLAAACAVGLAPTAIAAVVDAAPLRALLVLAISALLVTAGAFVRPAFRGLPGGLVFWIAGAVAATVVGFGRSVLNPTDEIGFELWSASGAAVLVTAAAAWHLAHRQPHVFRSAAFVAAVLILSLPTVAVVLRSSIDPDGFDGWRGILVLVATCAFLVVACAIDGLGEVARWVSLSAAAVLTATLVLSGTADPVELATTPFAAALLVGGGIRLARDRSRRSWPELGPGLLVLLLPSLAADLGSNELWRVVSLGVAALLVLGVGLTVKLQAPTLLGAGVVVVHAFAQLWPWIAGLYGSVPWWLWAGIGGVILIVLAATYESRIRDLRAVARGISSLR